MSTPGPELSLVCRPGKAGNVLTFPYRLENRGQTGVYVADALPAVDPATRKVSADDQAVTIILRGESEAVIGKIVAPPPADRRIAMPVIPLARLLQPGEALEGELHVRSPLAETSPYFSDLLLRDYEIVDLETVVFTIGFWPVDLTGLHAIRADYDPDRLIIVARDPTAGVKVAWQRFSTKGLQLFKRTDAFPRAI